MTRLLVPLLVGALAGCSGPTTQPVNVTPSNDGAFLVIADMRGTLKPCGCSPDLQRGGVDRITHWLKKKKIK